MLLVKEFVHSDTAPTSDASCEHYCIPISKVRLLLKLHALENRQLYVS